MALFEKPLLTWSEPGGFTGLYEPVKAQWLGNLFLICFYFIFLFGAGSSLFTDLSIYPLSFALPLEFCFFILVVGGPFTYFYLARYTNVPMEPSHPVEVFDESIVKKCGKGNQYIDFCDVASYAIWTKTLRGQTARVVELYFHDPRNKRSWHLIKALAVEDSEKLTQLLAIFRERGISEQVSL